MAHRIGQAAIALVTLAILVGEWIWIAPGLAWTTAGSLFFIYIGVRWGRDPFRNWPNF